MTVEELIEQAHRRGLRLNNLFQLRTGAWRANFRNDTTQTPYVYGEGPTMVKALEQALDPPLKRATIRGKPFRDQVTEAIERAKRVAEAEKNDILA